MPPTEQLTLPLAAPPVTGETPLVPAHLHHAGARGQAPTHHLRRADQRPRCLRAGTDPDAVQNTATRLSTRLFIHYPQHQRRGIHRALCRRPPLSGYLSPRVRIQRGKQE